MYLYTKILNKQYQMDIKRIIKIALDEDIPKNDITTELLIPHESKSIASIIAKEPGILCGIEIVKECLHYADKTLKYIPYKKDGQRIKKGDVVLKVTGSTKAILKVERTALNFLQHLSGIASYTNQMVRIATPYNVEILDTRKTLPGLRYLEKYAVKTGGGKNHRLNLSDEILIKENHITANGNIEETIKKLKSKYHKNFEIEVETLEEFKIALKYKVPFILLDNFSLKNIIKAVRLNQGRAKLEVSGGVNLHNLKQIVKTGINFVSIGSITHSAPAIDFSLLLK